MSFSNMRAEGCNPSDIEGIHLNDTEAAMLGVKVLLELAENSGSDLNTEEGRTALEAVRKGIGNLAIHDNSSVAERMQ